MRLAVLLLIAVVLALPAAAHAHGGGTPVITRQPVGDLLLYAWSAPAAPRANEPVHITVGLTRPGADGSETPVTDLAVTIKAESADGARMETAAAPGASAGGFYSEADLTLAEGAWTLTIEAPPAGSASFELVVLPPAAVRPGLIGLGAGLLAAGALLAVLYAAATRRGRRKVESFS